MIIYSPTNRYLHRQQQTHKQSRNQYENEIIAYTVNINLEKANEIQDITCILQYLHLELSSARKMTDFVLTDT